MFCIRGYPRCGTHMLRTALDSHPGVTCLAEIFNEGRFSAPLRAYEPLDWLRKQTQPIKNRPGFILHGHVPYSSRVVPVYERMWKALETFRVPMIVMKRRDLLRRAASMQMGVDTGVWKSYTPVRTPTTQIELDVNTLERNIHEVQFSYSEAARRFPWAHTVYYEDMVSDWRNQIVRIQKYLRLKVYDLNPLTNKQDDRPLPEIISNWEELNTAWNWPGSRLEDLFEGYDHETP